MERRTIAGEKVSVPIGGEGVPRARRTLRRRQRTDVLIVDLATGSMHVLNAAAISVLDACDGQRTVDQIVMHLAEAMRQVASDLDAQVRVTLEQLAAGNLVDWQ